MLSGNDHAVGSTPSELSLRGRLSKHWRTPIIALGVPILALLMTLILRNVLPSLTLFIFILAVAICAYMGGFMTALLSAVWSIILIETFLAIPTTMTQQMPLWYALFLSIIACIAWLQEQLRKANERLSLRTDQLNAILNAVSDGITVQDRDGNYTFANHAASRLTGLTQERILSISRDEIKNSYQMFDEVGEPLVPEDMPFYKALNNGVRAHMVLRAVSPYIEGERWFSVTAVPILDGYGRAQSAVNAFHDITERKNAEAEQKALQAMILAQAEVIDGQRRRLEDLLDTVPVMVWEGEGDPAVGQRMIYVNRYGEELLGYSLAEWTSEPAVGVQWIHPDDMEMAMQKTIQNYQTGKAEPFEFRIIAKSGRIVTVEARALIVRNAQGEAVGARGVMVDISERRRIEEELRRSNEELQQFAYVASHDLQEPLRMITSYLQLLNERYADRLDGEAREFIGYAVDGATRMKALIIDLLAHSRVQTNTERFQAVDMNGVVERARRNLAAKIEESAAVIEVSDLPTVTGNSTMLTQLMQNLLGNALKFRAQEVPKISIRAERQLNNWVFSVQDNGIGIDPKHAERIFVIFQRLHSRAKYTGTGIGLAICKKVVERHHGRMWVKSEKGAGATFYFTLPVHTD